MNDLQKKNTAILDKWFNDNSTVWIPPAKPLRGKQKILVLFRAIFSKYNSLNWEVKEVHEVSDDRFIYNSKSWGEFRNGITYHNEILTDIAFDDNGQITNLSDFFKDTSFS